MSFTRTASAQRFMRMMIRADGGPGAGFRLAVAPGGCASLSAKQSRRVLQGVLDRAGRDDDV